MGSDAVKVALDKRRNLTAITKKRPEWYNAVQELIDTQARQDSEHNKALLVLRNKIRTDHRRVSGAMWAGLVCIVCIIGLVVIFDSGVLSWP